MQKSRPKWKGSESTAASTEENKAEQARKASAREAASAASFKGDASSDESQSDDDEMDGKDDMKGSVNSADGLDDQSEAFVKMRREKRLAMNRASARARRKRKKILLDSLANQVTELTKKNTELQSQNDTLKARVEQLESALLQAQTTIQSLVADSTRAPAPPEPQLGSMWGSQQQQPQQQPQPQQQHNAGAGLSTSNEDAIRTLLMGAVPALFNNNNMAAPSPAPQQAANDPRQQLLAQLLAGQQQQQQQQPQQQQQQQQQQNPAQMLDLSALRNAGLPANFLNSLQQDPIGSFLGQARMQQNQQQGQQGLGGSQGDNSGSKRGQDDSTNNFLEALLKKARR